MGFIGIIINTTLACACVVNEDYKGWVESDIEFLRRENKRAPSSWGSFFNIFRKCYSLRRKLGSLNYIVALGLR